MIVAEPRTNGEAATGQLPNADDEQLWADLHELTPGQLQELQVEADQLKWSSRPTTSSGRCC